MLRSRVLLLLAAVAVTAAALPSGASAAKGTVLKCGDLTVPAAAFRHPGLRPVGDPATDAFRSQILSTFITGIGAANTDALHPGELLRTTDRVDFAIGMQRDQPGYLRTFTARRSADGTWSIPEDGVGGCAVTPYIDGHPATAFNIGVKPKPQSRRLVITTPAGKCFGKVRSVRQTWSTGSVTLFVLVGRPARTGSACTNPPTRRTVRTVKLRRALGHRTVRDGSVFPYLIPEYDPECALTNTCYEG